MEASASVSQEHQSQGHSLTANRGNIGMCVASFLMGAVACYFLDPDRGRRRRALLKDQAVSKKSEIEETAEKLSKHIQNKAEGIYSKVTTPLSKKEETTDDDTLENRVRSHLGREIAHLKSIQTKVENGRVILSGVVKSSEVKKIVSCVKKVAGVDEVINNLEVKKKSRRPATQQGEGPEYVQ